MDVAPAMWNMGASAPVLPAPPGTESCYMLKINYLHNAKMCLRHDRHHAAPSLFSRSHPVLLRDGRGATGWE
jgi:hypothetical protein